jgi:hypothetical protein
MRISYRCVSVVQKRLIATECGPSSKLQHCLTIVSIIILICSLAVMDSQVEAQSTGQGVTVNIPGIGPVFLPYGGYTPSDMEKWMKDQSEAAQKGYSDWVKRQAWYGEKAGTCVKEGQKGNLPCCDFSHAVLGSNGKWYCVKDF